MKREYVLISLFFLICAVFFYLAYQIIIPFISPIIWAAIFAILFFPLYERLRDRMKIRGIASMLTCLLIIVLIIGPVTYLFVALVNEATDAVTKVNEYYRSGELERLIPFDLPWLQSIKAKLGQYFDISKINPEELVREAVNKVSSILVSQTTWLIANGTKAVFFFGIMIFTMYYFFKDGEELIRKIKRLMPLTPDQVERTFKLLRDVIFATMYGGVVVALIQGLLGGILFACVGIPSPIFWGAIMAFLSVLPIVGAFLVYIPAGIILIIGGSWVTGLVVILIGTLVISQVDNLIRPYLISGRTAMHPLVLFFAIMGGIAVFNILGLVMGPFIAAVFLTLLKIFELKLHPEAPPEELRSVSN